MQEPLRQLAYTRFREGLSEQKLRPGQFVSQRQLSEMFDVPMGAIREALKRLEADGLISLIAQRGVQIADINVEFINEAFEFRILIEIEAVRRMARSPDLQQLATIRKRTGKIIKDLSGKQSDQLMKDGLQVDLELHELLMSGFSNKLIRDSYRLLEDKIRLIRVNGRYTSVRLGAAMEEHLEIIDALAIGDETLAVDLMQSHLNTSWRRSLGIPGEPT